MKTHNFIGKITIEEKVNAVTSATHPKALIIDVPNPLATYYSHFTDVQKPNSIVLVTKDANSFEHILRATKKVNITNDLNLNAAKCEVHISSRKMHGIRLKGLAKYTHIDTILPHYENEGFNFTTNNKLKLEQLALIRVNKFFDVEEVNDTVLRSLSNKNKYYFKLNNPLAWNDFKERTLAIKHNIPGSDFDIAQAILYNKGEINDIVRVVKPDLSLDLVQEIERRYNR